MRRLLGPLLLLLLLVPPSLARAAEERHRGAVAAAYLKEVHRRIHPRWTTFLKLLHTLPPGTRYRDDKSLEVEVVIAIRPDGVPEVVERTSLSGLGGFDDAVSDLVADLGRLPAPNRALRSDDGRVFVRWRFGRGEAACEQHVLFDMRLPVEQAVPTLFAAGRVEEAAARIDELLPAEVPRAQAMASVLAELVARRDVEASDPARRALAAVALGHAEDAEGPLLQLSRDPRAEVRSSALRALGDRPRSPAAVAALLTGLAGGDAAPSAQALARLGATVAVPALRAALADGRAPVEVTLALLDLSGPEATRAAVAAVLAPDAKPQMAAFAAARVLADPSLGAPLGAVYSSATALQRVSILGALAAPGRRVTAETRTLIVSALRERAPMVRAAAMLASVRIGESSNGLRYRMIDSLPDESPEVRAAAAAALVEGFGEAVRDELIPAWRDHTPAVRVALGRALIGHPFAGSWPLLKRLMSDADPAVRRALFESLAAAADPHARSMATSALDDPLPELQQLAFVTPPRRESASVLIDRLLEATMPLERVRAAAAWLTAVAPAHRRGSQQAVARSESASSACCQPVPR